MAHTIILKEGFSVDGWKYEIGWRDWDGKFQVVFDDDKREIWLLEDVYAEKRDGGGIVYVKGKLYTAHPENFMKALMGFAKGLAYWLEEEGKSAIKRFGKATLLFEAVLPRRSAAFKRSVLAREMAEEIERRKAELAEEKEAEKKTEEWIREIERAEKAERKRRAVTPKKRLGLGRNELSRLRVLFQSTCDSLGIKVTRSLKIKATQVIYLLESKYKSLPRDEALEKATIDLLRWIKEAVYRVPLQRKEDARVLWQLYTQAVLIGDVEKAEKTLEELKRLATKVD